MLELSPLTGLVIPPLSDVTLATMWLRGALSRIKVTVGGVLAAGILFVLARTIRWTRSVPKTIAENEAGVVIVFWHGRLLMMPHLYHFARGTRHKPYMLISQHGDGRIIAIVCRLLGIRSAAGSSTRGGTRALLRLIRRAQEGSDIGFTPDGPRGPRYEVKDGVVVAAIKTGCQVAPCTYSTERRWQLRSWDGMIIPKPFSRGVFLVGDPITVAEGDDLEASRLRIQGALRELTERADSYWSSS